MTRWFTGLDRFGHSHSNIRSTLHPVLWWIFTYDPWLISRPRSLATSLDDLGRRFGHMNGPHQASSNVMQKSPWPLAVRPRGFLVVLMVYSVQRSGAIGKRFALLYIDWWPRVTSRFRSNLVSCYMESYPKLIAPGTQQYPSWFESSNRLDLHVKYLHVLGPQLSCLFTLT
jgi:hypothetical protein